jgi:hypothetical protein
MRSKRERTRISLALADSIAMWLTTWLKARGYDPTRFSPNTTQLQQDPQ